MGSLFARGEGNQYKVDPVYGETCEYCDGTIPFGNCYTCNQPLELVAQGQFEDGEHVCSTDCVNPICER